MPFYEYRCEACGHEIEALQKVSDEPLLDCPECGRPALKKLMSAVGFRLKGGGWYVSEYGNKKPNSATASSEPAATEKKPEAPAPAAPAPKADA